jgi:hypothetical protein
MIDSRIFGFCPWPEDRLTRYILAGGDPCKVPGDWVITIRTGRPDGEETTTLASSILAAVPYYYSETAGRLFHGSHVLEVWKELWKELGRDWSWDRQGLYEYFHWEQCLDDRTLHPDIKRFPEGAVARFSGGRLSIKEFSNDRDWFSGRSSSLDELNDRFEEICADYPFDEGSAISLSAGVDSRLLLAGFMGKKLKPPAVTAGHERSTDVMISRRISQDFGLDHETLEMRPELYPRYAREIVELTGGTEPGFHWHTFIYPRLARSVGRETFLFVGNNGEFAKTMLFDRGIMAHVFDHSPGLLFEIYLRLKSRSGHKGFPFEVSDMFGDASLRRRNMLTYLLEKTRPFKRNLDKIDIVYTWERVRHFMGSGLALYGGSCLPVDPFLDYRWIEAIGPMARNLKLNGRIHRYLIKRRCPELLRYPTHNCTITMEKDVLLYWLRKGGFTGYEGFDRWALGKEAREYLLDNIEATEIGLRKEHAEKVYASEHIYSLSLLIPLVYLCEFVSEFKARDM